MTPNMLSPKIKTPRCKHCGALVRAGTTGKCKKCGTEWKHEPVAPPPPDPYILRAIRLIAERRAVVYDVAIEYGQMVDNVAHMKWFVEAVADAIRPDK